MLVRFSKSFSKQYDKADEKIKSAFDKRLKLFLENPFSQLLNNHPLAGNFIGYRSINITGDWRALYCEYKTDDEGFLIVFYFLGTHSQLYK